MYWLGPLLGSLLATEFYKILKALDYEAVNGEQELSKVEIKDERTRDLESGQRISQ
jgi:aquaporin related protein